MKSLCQKWPNSAIGAICPSIFQFRYEAEGELIWRYLNLKMNIAKELGVGQTRSLQLDIARHAEMQISALAKDIKILTQLLRRDVLALAGPCLATPIELFDFVTAELLAREHLDPNRIRPVRIALQNQRDDLLAFAGGIDDKLEDIAQTHNLSACLVRQACVLHRKPSTSPLYWQGWMGYGLRWAPSFTRSLRP